MNRFTVSRSATDEENIAIIDDSQDKMFQDGKLSDQAQQPAPTNYSTGNESVELIPPVETKRPKKKSPLFKKYGSTSTSRGNYDDFRVTLNGDERY